MLEKKIINIAVHGVGTIGKRHLMAMNENQNVNLSGIIDISDEAKPVSYTHLTLPTNQCV